MYELDAFQNMHQLFQKLREDRRDDKLFQILKAGKISCVTGEQFFADVALYQGYLMEMNLQTDKIALLGPSTYEWMVSFISILDLGLCPVLLASDAPEEEIRELLEMTDTRTILCPEEMKKKCQLPDVQVGSLFDTSIRSTSQAAFSERNLEDPAVILFTSGTTGKKKAVVLSQQAVLASIINDLVPFHFETQLAILPFHHMAGYNPVLNTICLGSSICLMDHPGHIFEAFALAKCDYLFVVPAMAKMIAARLAKSDVHGESLDWNLRYLGCGGAKFPPEVLNILKEKDVRIIQGYGATECGGIGFSWEMDPLRPDTIGKPHELMEVKLEEGELLVKSRSLMSGYYNDIEGTKEVLKDGWYYTGDLAEIDDEGYVNLVGRKKNLIILSNGENISPEEIEKKWMKCPFVAEVVITEHKDKLAAIIYPSEPEKEEVIRCFMDEYNQSVVSYKRIQYLKIREEPFEKNAMMKIIRTGVYYE